MRERITVAVVTRGGVVFHPICFRRWRGVLMRYGGPEGEARCLEGSREAPVYRPGDGGG